VRSKKLTCSFFLALSPCRLIGSFPAAFRAPKLAVTIDGLQHIQLSCRQIYMCSSLQIYVASPASLLHNMNLRSL